MKAATQRLTQVFRFLKGLNELRNPVPRDLTGYSDVLRLDAWPSHPCIVVRRGDREGEDTDEEVKMDPFIRIQRPQLTTCPKPPPELEGWLKPGWQSVDDEPEVLESRNFIDKEKKAFTVAFTDDHLRREGLELWSDTRAKWVQAERPAIEALRIFERIHGLWTS